MCAIPLGVACIVYGVMSLAQVLVYLSSGAQTTFTDFAYALSSFVLAVTGMVLLALLPEAMRAKFRLPSFTYPSKPVYGFSQVLAVGLGATLGSPLFILVPENVLQYEVVSIGALTAATVLSVLMAKVYADMYLISKSSKLGAVGGPSFTKAACGKGSLRYFVSRVSMWVANTALAAYSKIVFVVFDVEYLPNILTFLGTPKPAAMILVYAVAAVFVGWSVASALFERRLLKPVGYIQIVFTAFMVAALAYHSYALGSLGSWNLTGLIGDKLSGNWVSSLVIDTGYLYLLFFGFQEIQSLERDTFEESSVPIVSWIKKGFKLRKENYLGVTMVLSVVIAAAINIFYAIAVYSVHPSLSAVFHSQIPALYLARKYLGGYQELLMALVFLIATLTTFVPAFLAASRHMAALCEDGFMPRGLAPYSWVFTYGSILFLALGGENFLVDITNVMVLLSLGIITLSAVWIKKKAKTNYSTALPIGVGASCFVAGGAIYFIDPRVTVFAALTLLITYLVYDVFILGSTGSQMFVAVFDTVLLLLLSLVGSQSFPVYTLSFLGSRIMVFSLSSAVETALLIAGVVVLAANLMLTSEQGGRGGGRGLAPRISK